MKDTHLTTLDEIDVFLADTEAVVFTFPDATARYAWLQATQIQFGYAKLSRRQKACCVAI